MLSFKKKLKLELIEEFIKVYQCKSYYDFTNFDNDKYKQLSLHLLNSYEILLFRFRLMDESFLLLKQELSNSKLRTNNTNEIDNVLIKLVETFKLKLKKLKLNIIENNYLLCDIDRIMRT